MKRLLVLALALAPAAHAQRSPLSAVQEARIGGTGPGWGPAQATGAPDAPPGDNQRAWATLGADEGLQWLELDYATAVPIESVRIFENCNPGAVVKVEARDEGGEPTVLWEGTAPIKPEPHVFTVDAGARITAKRIRLILDTSKIPGWNEVDAVELIGRDGSHQWATAARASSTYAAIGGGGGPLVELQGQSVRVRIGGETLFGKLGVQSNGFIPLETSLGILQLNPAQIDWISGN